MADGKWQAVSQFATCHPPFAICHLLSANGYSPYAIITDMATVKIKYRNKEYEVNTGMTVREAIKKIGLEPEAVLAVHDGKLITDDIVLREGMEIKLVAVVSGGTLPAPSGRWARGER
ncbi:MAG: MoaD/ThiS family protein [Anaerolineales bacterium]|nr:MoaD/ThiS family protein [Anaerolineales bacterium]